MRTEHLLISITGLLLGFCMLLGGIFLFLVGSFPKWQRFFDFQAFTSIGLVFMFTGLLFLTLLYFLSRRRYLRLQIQGPSIDKRAIEQAVDSALQPIFPGKVVATGVIVRGKRRLEILADIPYPSEEKMTLIENTLKETLSTQLGYNDDFTLNIGLNR